MLTGSWVISSFMSIYSGFLCIEAQMQSFICTKLISTTCDVSCSKKIIPRFWKIVFEDLHAVALRVCSSSWQFFVPPDSICSAGWRWTGSGCPMAVTPMARGSWRCMLLTSTGMCRWGWPGKSMLEEWCSSSWRNLVCIRNWSLMPFQMSLFRTVVAAVKPSDHWQHVVSFIL